MPVEIQGTFVTEKINKIRWIPEDYADPKCFFTGSWDNDVNSVKVWSFESNTDEEDADYPRQVSEYQLNGDVTEIIFVEKNCIAVSCSDGSVRILEISAYDKSSPLKEFSVWEGLHRFGNESCSCSSLAALDGEITTVGEDGRLNVLNVRRGVTRSIEEADSCSLHCICYIKHNEVITGNLRGHMKIWDLRSPTNKPSASFLLSGDQSAATCVTQHPTQHHMILAGSEGGSLAIWDLRVNTYPASLLSAHSANVNEIKFHPETPRKLFTCSASGELWDWNMDLITRNSTNVRNGQEQALTTWLPLGEEKNKMMATSLMPNLHKSINSLDCYKNKVVCGADNEAVYVLKNILY